MKPTAEACFRRSKTQYNMSRILITGADGLIGTRLQEMLRQQGHSIHTIGRSRDGKKKAGHFTWDIARQVMDPEALNGVDAIVHLAGAGVADQRWTDARKKEIYDSRIDSTRLLYTTLSAVSHQVSTVVSASAVGYYGDRGPAILRETEPAGDSFLAKVVADWEQEVARVEELGIRHVCCRIGIVLSRDGGALPELARTIPLGIAGYFARPDLYYPWVHIDDVCGIMMHAIAAPAMRGSYNTTAPHPVLIKEMMKAIVDARKSHAILTPVPPFALKLGLGEMAEVVLQSQRCSDSKIVQGGYKFRYPDLKGALESIYQGH